MSGNGTNRNDPSGLRSGVNHGKTLFEKKAKLYGDINMPKVRAGGDFGFPVAVAPWNQSEADMREKTDVFTNYVDGIKLPDKARVNFNVDTDALISMTHEKRGALERLQFYEWLGQIMKDYNFSPDIVNFVKGHYPEYFEEQISLIEDNLALQKRAAMLAVKIIPDSREDLEFLYALNTGQIKLPNHVAYLPDVGDKTQNLSRGLFSIHNYGTPGKVPTSAPFGTLAGLAADKSTPLNYNTWANAGAVGKGTNYASPDIFGKPMKRP